MQRYTTLEHESGVEPAENGYLVEYDDAKRETDKLLTLLNPRFWTREMHQAWHQNIPDLMAAFEALRKLAQ